MLSDTLTRRDPDLRPGYAHAQPFTRIDLTRIAGRVEQWVRFGRIAATKVTGPGQRTIFFRAGATFAVVRGTSSDFGTINSSIAIVSAVAAGRPCACLPHVQPGGELLLRVDGGAKVQRVLAAIDAVEAAGLDACDVSPDHWRHVSDCVGAGTLFRPYGAERHAAWLRRRAIEA